MSTAGNKAYEVDKAASKEKLVNNLQRVQKTVSTASQRMRLSIRAAMAESLYPSLREGPLIHSSNRHTLLRVHIRESEGIKCNFCDICISGCGYVCEQYCDYYLHEVCSKFPSEIRHDFHPGYDHTLVLRPFHQLATGQEQFHCAACGDNDSDHSLFQSYYCCESCNFNLHVECASIPIFLNQKVNYPLHLFFSFPKTSEAATPFCSVCAKAVPVSGCWVFYNHDHGYLCHLSCGAETEYGVDNDSIGKLLNRLQSLAITNRPPTRAGDRQSGDTTHFTHRHSLKEFNSDNPLKCNLCNFEFLTGYFCRSCNYFIDIVCFSLPFKIQHMSHPQHPLKLTWSSDFEHKGLECPACQNYVEECSRRGYICLPCKFFIDPFCASAPKTLTLEDDNVSYELFFSFPFKHEKADIKCNSCSHIVVIKNGMLYYNFERDEALLVACALIEEAGYDREKRGGLLIQRLSEKRIAD